MKKDEWLLITTTISVTGQLVVMEHVFLTREAAKTASEVMTQNASESPKTIAHFSSCYARRS
jgi:hypothetical protein